MDSGWVRRARRVSLLDELEPSLSTLASMFPTASEFHDDIDSERNEALRAEFDGIVNFPFSNVELSLLSVHPQIVEPAQSLLDCDEVLVTNAG